MAPEELTIDFRNATLDVEFALKAIQAEFAERHIPTSGFELYGEPVDLREVCSRLKQSGRKTFNLVGRGFVFQLSSVRNFELDFLGIKATSEHRSSWDRWVARFIEKPDFVMAWLADVEYEFWQNAEDPLQYTTKRRPHQHLPRKSNGLPPPLEQIIIDISGNPGRRLLRPGYHEVVGAVMWLGEPFWQLTKADKDAVEHAHWIQVSYPLSTTVRIEVAAESFTTDEGAVGELQRKLRALLFPEPTMSSQVV